jgi:hypothetical protein
VVGDVDLRGAVRSRTGRDLLRARPDDDSDRVAERGRLREDAEPALLERVAVMLEEDEEVQRSRLSFT